MTAKEFLSQAYRLDERIKSKRDQIQSLNDLATSCTANISGMPHSPNAGRDKLGDTIAKIVDLQESIADDMDRLVSLKAEIVETIKTVDNADYQLILEMRYITEKSWPEIAVELGYKMRWLYKLHDEALEIIKIPEKYLTVQ